MTKRTIVISMYILGLSWMLAVAGSVVPPSKWIVRTHRPAAHDEEVRRGESENWIPQYVSYDGPWDISDAYSVLMRYRSEDMTNGYYYVVTGSVYNATNGQVLIPWTPAAEGHTNKYDYEIACKSVEGDMLKAYGTIEITGGDFSGAQTSSTPVAMHSINWGTVEHSNLGDAPFVNEYETDLEGDTVGDNAANTNVAVQGIPVSNEVPAAGQVWIMQPDGTMAPGDIITTLDGDATGSGTNVTVVAIRGIPVTNTVPEEGEVWVMGANGVMVPGSVATNGGGTTGSSMSTNYWKLGGTNSSSVIEAGEMGEYRKELPSGAYGKIVNINGTEIGYWSTNGITLYWGTLDLQNSNLECNVSMYHGSKALPALRFLDHATKGFYLRSLGGDYAWMYAHAGDDVFYLDDNGLHATNDARWYGRVYLPDGTALVPSLRWSCNAGNMGLHSKSWGGDSAVAFAHGVGGDVFWVDDNGIYFADDCRLTNSHFIGGADMEGILALKGATSTNEPAARSGWGQIQAFGTSTNTEIRVCDGVGNWTTISTHKGDRYVLKSQNIYTGRKISIDIEAMAKAVEQITGEQIMTVETVEPRDWQADQRARRQASLRRRQEWNRKKSLRNAWKSLPEHQRKRVPAPEPVTKTPPELYQPEPEPDWIKTRRAELKQIKNEKEKQKGTRDAPGRSP